jgi:hypothetical protein
VPVLAFIRRTEFPLSVHGRSAARVEPLAAALELCVRKWTNLGLAPELLQQLLCDCHRKFHDWSQLLRSLLPLTSGPRQELFVASPELPRPRNYHKAAVASLCEMETKTRQTLNAAGVHTIMYVPYLSYARQLYKLSRQQGISGESFALVSEVLLDKWAARGLDAAVLARIRTEVFDVVAPAP